MFAVPFNTKFTKVKNYHQNHHFKLILIIFRRYQLPDCAISLKLLVDFHPRQYISSTVQVMGEVRLYNPQLDLTYNNLESSYTLIHRLNELRANDSTQCLEAEIEAIKTTYMPIIQVQSIRAMPDAKEIIVENLNFRLLQRRISAKFK